MYMLVSNAFVENMKYFVGIPRGNNDAIVINYCILYAKQK